MAQPNYSFAKRQRELAKQRKKEEKARKKAEAKAQAQVAQQGPAPVPPSNNPPS